MSPRPGDEDDDINLSIEINMKRFAVDEQLVNMFKHAAKLFIE